jgi:crotonobetainyl-CoA:carnitine CoA-transferase CaiB-like acyl-CoA transferase
MSRSESGIKRPPAELGEHTAAVLQELLGLDAAAVADLEARGIVMTENEGPDVARLFD